MMGLNSAGGDSVGGLSSVTLKSNSSYIAKDKQTLQIRNDEIVFDWGQKRSDDRRSSIQFVLEVEVFRFKSFYGSQFK